VAPQAIDVRQSVTHQEDASRMSKGRAATVMGRLTNAPD
jgi:hypothetical protein